MDIALSILPNTAIATLALSKSEIYTYAQLYDGRIVEFPGQLAGDDDTYLPKGQPNVIAQTNSPDAAAKRFTPLAAVYFENRRTVFYLDPSNVLRDVSSSDGVSWQQGDLYLKQWTAAEYSSLAAIKLSKSSNKKVEFICLYYQDTTATGNIVLVNHNHVNGWQTGNPPLNDPPLYGTPLAAVNPQPGIEVTEVGDKKDPVIFFQYDNLLLGSSQDQGAKDYAKYAVAEGISLSARGAITGLDDGTHFWCFYTTDSNEVYRLRVDANGAISQPQKVALDTTPTPKSALAGALINDGGTTKVVLFYLLRQNHVNIFASTLTMKTTQDTGTWDVSPSICIAPEPTYPIVGIPAGATAPAIPLRLEADSWYPGTTEEHLVQNSLFLYALKALQARDPRDKLSFFQIGGIHGMPFQPWDEDTTQKTPQEGYCTHDSLLFPCWHRPYVLLFEQALYQIMIEEIIPKLPGLLQSKWQSYAATWRLPYWDWALKKTRDGKTSPVYDIPLIAKEPRIGVYDLSDGTSVVYIDNPMYKFTMPGKAPMHEYGVLDVVDDPQDIPYERCVGTSRWAVYSPESTESSEDWIDGTVNNSMIAQAITDHDWYNNPSSIENVPLTEMVYRLFVRDYIDNYTQFATTKHKKSTDDNSDAPMAFLNLEFVHNNIHNWTGGTGSYIGHMTEVPVAGFDPIFFFHHCNVDRLFALWQAVNQNRPKKNWFDDPSEQLPDDGNWSLPEGTMDTPTTNLAPFHSDAVGTYYTPDKVRDWTTLGYSYPELQPWLEKYVNGAGNFDEDAYIADVQSQIEKLYSPGSSSSKALSLGFEHWTKDVIVNITYDRFAFAGVPYTIYFFIGNPDKFGDSNDASSPLTNHPQHVGYVYTFSNPVLPDPASGKAGCKNCLKKRASGSRSRAQVPITGALVARLRTGNGGGEAGQLPASIPPLSSLERGSVDEYLEKNLHWRVTSHNGTELPIPEHDPYIRVEVYHRDARFDDRANAAPYRRLKKATGTKLGGYRPGEPGH